MGRIRKIDKRSMISHLSCITMHVLDDYPEPPEDLALYDEYVDLLCASLDRSGESEDLRLTLALVLGRDDVDIEQFNAGEFPWTDDELRRVFRYAYDKLWPDHPIPPGGPTDVELVKMTFDEWQAYKRSRPS